MRRFFVFLCITAVVMAQRSKIHEEMTEDEIIYTFGNDIEDDPNYEVVSIAHGDQSKSSDHKVIQLTSFSREMRFYLEPTDGYLAGVNTPVFRARHNPGMTNEVEYKRIPGAITGKHKLYQDPTNNAAVVIHYDHMGYPLINGVIKFLKEKYSLVIRPLLSRFQKFFQRNKRSDDLTLFNRTVQHPGLEYTHHHVVYKIPHAKTKKVDDYEDDDDDDYSYESEVIDDDSDKHDHGQHVHLESDEQLVGDGHGHIDLVAMARGKRKRNKDNNNVPGIVYPQVLVIVDFGLFKHFKGNVPSIIEYLLAFWNGVDLRYRAYQKPEIRLNIAGIILAEDYSMTPYITNNRAYVREFGKNKIDITSALRSKAAFMFPETTKNNSDQTLTMKRLGFKFDFVITMTTLDMCQLPMDCIDEQTREYTCNVRKVRGLCDTLGFAYYTGGCAYDDQYLEMEGVGIIEDKGSFFGIIPTAHEIGHLLGASHNQLNEHKCDWDDGYLMSYSVVPKQESFIWSNCSAESVKFFLKREKRAQCMFDKPNTGSKIPRKLPGKMYSRDEICDRAIPGARACKESLWLRNHCAILYCQPPNTDSCADVRFHLVPEGAFCGKGRYCLNGLCVNETDPYVHLELATTTQMPLTQEERYLPMDEDDNDNEVL